MRSFQRSVPRLALRAWMGLPAGVRPGSPHHFQSDRAYPAKAVAICPSLYAFPATGAPASPSRSRTPRGAP